MSPRATSATTGSKARSSRHSSADYKTGNAAQFYGKVSAVGERTFGAAPPLVGEDASSFDVEDAYIGWRSGTSLADGENVLDFTVGRTQYKLGHGMLLWDGARKAARAAVTGPTRARRSSSPRSAASSPATTRSRRSISTRTICRSPTRTASSGVLNYEYAFGEDTTLGATYMSWTADAARRRSATGSMSTTCAPSPRRSRTKALSFELEYAQRGQRRCARLRRLERAGRLPVRDRPGQPKLSYRYAFFEGDDPATAENEAFDGLFTGFYDWGTWWQGEIAGEYFVSNSNLISHQLRVHAKPNDAISTGLIFFDFLLDQPASFGPQVTSDDVGPGARLVHGLDGQRQLHLSFVAALRSRAMRSSSRRGVPTTFCYGMIFAAYSF